MEKKREEICLGAKSMHGTKWTQWVIEVICFFLNTFILKKKLKN